MQFAAHGFVVRFGRPLCGGSRGLLVDPERDGVRDELVTFAFAGAGAGRGWKAGVARWRDRLGMLGRG